MLQEMEATLSRAASNTRHQGGVRTAAKERTRRGSPEDPRKKKPPPQNSGGKPEEPEVPAAAVLAFRERLTEIMRYRGLSRRDLQAHLFQVAEEHFPDALGIKGMSQASVGRWFEAAGGPRMIHLLILARFLDTTLDVLLDPNVPVSELPRAGQRASSVSEGEQWLLAALRRGGIDPDEAFRRIMQPRSTAPTSDQVEEAMRRLLRNGK